MLLASWILPLASGVSTGLGQQSGETGAPKQELSVLYAGCPGSDRETDFVRFLREHFARVEATSLPRLTMDAARPFDVVIADWRPRYKYVDGKAKSYDSSLAPGAQLPVDFTRPVVMIGAVGGELARWSKIGWL